MQYEPIKEKIYRFIGDNRFYRKVFYILLDIFILRQWYVKKAIKKYLPKTEEILFLDAGAGFCQYSDFVLSRYKKAKVCAVDLSIKSVGNAFIRSAPTVGNAFIRSAPAVGNAFIRSAPSVGNTFIRSAPSDIFPEAERINAFPTDGARMIFYEANLEIFQLTQDKADFVIAIDILEHIEDDIAVLKNFYASMNDNAYLLISTPSNQDSAAAFTEEHVRPGYSLRELIDKLETQGFIIIEHKYSYGFWGRLYWLLIMRNGVTIANYAKIILPFYLVIVFIPSIIFMILDTVNKNKSGNGIILVAKKIVDKNRS